MSIHLTEHYDAIDWQILSDLYSAAGMGNKTPAQLETAFPNSLYCCFLHAADGQLIGAGRAIGDGVLVAYLSDIAVHPAQQGQGLGQRLVAHLMMKLQGHQKILLYANPGKQDFYRRFGFRTMLTAMGRFELADQARQRGFTD